MALYTKTAYFSDDQVELLMEKAFTLLGTNGVKLDHPVVLEKMKQAGADVDLETKRVRLSKELLNKFISQAPESLVLAANDEAQDVNMPRLDGTFNIRPGTGSPFYQDPDTGEKRDVTIADIEDWARLIDGLDGIDFTPFPSPNDVPTPTTDIHALRAMLLNTSKHVWVQPYSEESIEYLIELAAVAAGGDEALNARPRISFITCSLTPLEFKKMDLEVMVQACPRNIPVHACSLPGTGTTSPITVPGTVILTIAEILTMLSVAQVINPGAPVIGAPLIFSGNMATGSSLQSSVEAIQGKSAAVQLVKQGLKIPVHTYGWGSDASFVGEQSGIESALLSSAIASVGSDVLGGAGQVEVATVLSPIQLVIDEEIGQMLRKIMGGLELNDDSMAWDVLLKTEPGANFLTQKHTFKHCRDAFAPTSFTRTTREQWEANGKPSLLDSAKARYRKIVGGKGEQELGEGVKEKLNAIVERADKNLVG